MSLYVSYLSVFDLRRRHLSEQYLTSSQQSAHFFRQVKGRLQIGQVFVGKLDLDLACPMI